LPHDPSVLRRFIEQYLVDHNASAAAERIGFGPGQARTMGFELLTSPGVGDAIGAALVERVKRTTDQSKTVPIIKAMLRRRMPLRAGVKALVTDAAARRGFIIRRLDGGESQGTPTLGAADPGEFFQVFHRGRCFYCTADSPVLQVIARGGQWDAHFEPILRAVARDHERAVIVEVGANIGASFIPLCAELPEHRFVLFEPVPRFFEALERNRTSYDAWNAELHNMAVSEGSSDAMVLMVDDVSGGFWAGGMLVGRSRAVVAKATSLDRHFVHDRIDLLKIDVDGFEWEVLRGADELIRRSRPHVLVEFNPHVMMFRGVAPRGVLQFLADRGVGVFELYRADGTFLESTSDIDRVVGLAVQEKHPYSYLDIHAHA
jgi:FkbM family methyltransferase